MTKEFIEKKLRQWGISPPIVLAYAICMAISGNGAKIFGMKIIDLRLIMVVIGLLTAIVDTALYAVVLTSAILVDVALPLAIKSNPCSTLTVSGLELCVRLVQLPVNSYQ